jgi:GAF domain-containing protein
MKRRSKGRATAVKVRRPKSARLKRQGMAKDLSGHPAADEKSEISRLARELKEARAKQRATSDILQVITSFAGELEPVFQAILANAARLCEANFGTLTLNERDTFRVVALHNVPEGFAELRRRHPTVRFGPKHPLARQIATKQVLHIADVKIEPAYLEGDPTFVRSVDLAGPRTLLNVPMLKANEVIGTIGIYRKEVRPFTKDQTELLKNFANQALIAIENARLLNELRQRTDDLTEALEQQTATSEVLQVISSSPGDLEPVFASMLENAVRICDATFGNIYRWDGEALHLLAAHNTPPAFAEARRRLPRRAATSFLRRMIATKTADHVTDVAATKEYSEERLPGAVTAVELGGVRTFLAVPMLHENELIGSFSLYRQEVRPFTDKQIALVSNFAAQAVIAIENSRLLNELRQSLEQQTATSQVLQVISSSSGDLQPGFASILANATRICEADFGVLVLYENAAFQVAATHNAPPAFVELRQRQPTIHASGALGRVVAAKQLVHISDCLDDASYPAVIHHDDVVASERRNQAVFDIGEEHLSGHGTFDRPPSGRPFYCDAERPRR